MTRGFNVDVHCVTGAPREAMCRVLKAEDSGMGGKGLWRPPNVRVWVLRQPAPVRRPRYAVIHSGAGSARTAPASAASSDNHILSPI